MARRKNLDDADRPRQETIGPFMSIDRGSNQQHYMKPPYAPHVMLSLDRGARSGMDISSPRPAASPTSVLAAGPRVNSPRCIEWMAHTRSAAPTRIVPSMYKLHSTSPRSRETVTKEGRKNEMGAKDPDRPRQETAGPLMSIDRGSNQLHYIKPPYAPHVQLSLDRGARSGLDTRSRRRPGH